MSTSEEMTQRLRKSNKKLIPSLAVNLILPWILYLLLHRIFANDTSALALTAAIPVIRTIVLWVWHRRIDWIGVIGTFAFAAAFIISIFYGGSSLPLKLIHPAIFGFIGIAFLVSVILRKPLLMTIVRIAAHNNQERFNSPTSDKKFTIMTALFGGIAVVGSGVHIVMALTLPTVTYVALSHLVSWATIFTLVVSGRIVARRL